MSIRNIVSQFITHSARARTRTALLALSDRQLEDAGYSRELLQLGVKAWPWRTDALESDTLMAAQNNVHIGLEQKRHKRSEIKRAIAELEQYSDRELADLGVSRHAIEHAVKHGRNGYANDVDYAAA